MLKEVIENVTCTHESDGTEHRPLACFRYGKGRLDCEWLYEPTACIGDIGKLHHHVNKEGKGHYVWVPDVF